MIGPLEIAVLGFLVVMVTGSVLTERKHRQTVEIRTRRRTHRLHHVVQPQGKL